MLRFRPSYANVTSTLALMLALCGGAYAAGALPVNSVGSRQLKKNAVVGGKIARGAVDGSKVRDKSLTTADINQSFAAPNATHASSSAALDKVTYKSAAASVGAQSFNGATAACDAGQHVVGGGVKVDDPLNGLLVDGYPDAANTAWTARVWNANSPGGPAIGFTVYAVCTSVAATG
jgi:hypothetical protein